MTILASRLKAPASDRTPGLTLKHPGRFSSGYPQVIHPALRRDGETQGYFTFNTRAQGSLRIVGLNINLGLGFLYCARRRRRHDSLSGCRWRSGMGARAGGGRCGLQVALRWRGAQLHCALQLRHCNLQLQLRRGLRYRRSKLWRF